MMVIKDILTEWLQLFIVTGKIILAICSLTGFILILQFIFPSLEHKLLRKLLKLKRKNTDEKFIEKLKEVGVFYDDVEKYKGLTAYVKKTGKIIDVCSINYEKEYITWLDETMYKSIPSQVLEITDAFDNKASFSEVEFIKTE